MEQGQEADIPLAARAGPLRELERMAETLEAAAEGDFEVRLRVLGEGPLGRIAGAANRLIARNAQLARELARLARRVAMEGRLSEAPVAATDPEEIAGLQGRKILLVDDDAANLFAVTSLLERHGMRVLPAQGARECFELLESNGDVDVVLMDVMMPEIDGLEATRRIRQRAEHAGLPIVALTAKALPGDRERCLEAGCSDFATKPVGPEALLALLSKWTRR